jgi:hypothetical protein
VRYTTARDDGQPKKQAASNSHYEKTLSADGADLADF